MLIRFDGYQLGDRVVSFCKSDFALERLADSGLDYLRIRDDCVEHYPSGVRLELTREALEALKACDDFDVFEIDSRGRAFRCYSDASSDNAIFITGRCNSSCIMCPDSDKMRMCAEIRDLATLLEIAHHIPSDARHLTITGGEPFMLGRNMFLLLEGLQEKFVNTEFLLLTNGRVFAINGYCNELKRTLPFRATVGIPLHGYNGSTHDRITQAEGSFDQTLAGIKNLLARQIKVELRIVVSRLSAEYMDQMADLIVAELGGVNCVKVIALEMLGSAAKNRDAVWIPYPMAFAKSKRAVRKLMASGIDVGLYNFPLCAVDEGYWSICEKSISDYKVRFLGDCESCAVRDACGGIFAGSLRFAARDIRTIERQA